MNLERCRLVFLQQLYAVILDLWFCDTVWCADVRFRADSPFKCYLPTESPTRSLQCKQIRRHSVAVHIPIISKVTVFITTYSPSSALMHCLKYTVQYCLEQKEGVLNCTCSNLFGDNLSEFKELHLIHSLSSFLCSCHYRLFVFIFVPPPFNSFISH